MMRSGWLIGAAALAITSTLVMAQDAPESLLPPGFDDPAPAPSPTAAPSPASRGASQPNVTRPAPSAPPGPGSTPVIQPIPSAPPAATPAPLPSGLPSISELESLSTDELDEALGLRPRFDIPAAARRSMEQVGLLSAAEGGLPVDALSQQPGAIVAAALGGTDGPLVSRWGHILLRRALVSRLSAPQGMNPVRFAALRARVLNSMGEHGAARALVQDIDTGNWDEALTDAALDAYIGTGDIVGACPAVRIGRSDREDSRWELLQGICNAYAGESGRANTDLTRALRRDDTPDIDVLLAQRFAGAAGRGRRAVNLEWDGVDELSPWRFALATALGAELPDNLSSNDSAYYQRIRALSPSLPLEQRVSGAQVAAREGIMSSAAMVDLYSQHYAQGGADPVASRLREAYVGNQPASRLAAIRDVWGGAQAADPDYARQVLTAFAAARIPANEEFIDDAGLLVSSMLSAGLDRDAMEWGSIVPEGSLAWAQLALAQPRRSNPVSGGALDDFMDDDTSVQQRKTRFLLAGLAGLGRLESDDVDDFAESLGVDLVRQSKWSRLIGQAAATNNQPLVAYLAGLGMQGSSWDQMTARHLFHIVSALDQVGLSAEARMIAAEAVARG